MSFGSSAPQSTTHAASVVRRQAQGSTFQSAESSTSPLPTRVNRGTRMSFSGNAGKVRHQCLDSRDSNSDSSNASSASVSALNLASASTKLGEESPPKHKEDVPMPTDYLSLKVSELKPLLKERGLILSGRKAEMVSRLEEYDAARPTSKSGGEAAMTSTTKWKAEEKWASSFAKAMLVRLFRDEKSKIHSMTPDEIHSAHPAFKCYPRKRFLPNLCNLKTSLELEKRIVAQDERNFERDMARFPRGEFTSRGKLFWDSHRANEILKQDLDVGKLKSMRPKDLWLTRPEYRDFDSDDFCKYVHQELRARREKPYWIPKRNQAGLQKHNAEVLANKNEFDNHVTEEDLDGIRKSFSSMYV